MVVLAVALLLIAAISCCSHADLSVLLAASKRRCRSAKRRYGGDNSPRY